MSSKDIVIYKNKENKIELEVDLKDETIWLDLNRISRLFQRDKSVISRHINNIYKTNELEQNSTVAFFATVQTEGNRKIKREIQYYNLDVILSVGYRVNSKVGTQFRIWASNILKEYITEGYVINQKRLEQDSKKWSLLQLQMKNLQQVLNTRQLTEPEAKSLIKVITDYTQALSLLDKVDKQSIPSISVTDTRDIKNLDYDSLIQDIDRLKKELNLGDLFGKDTKDGLKSILMSINQTFDKRPVYPTIESKASNLLYLIIKNHPFIDGNKKIASFVFVRYLDINGILYREDGSKRIEESTLVAIALLLAQSDTKEKDSMIDLVSYLIHLGD